VGSDIMHSFGLFLDHHLFGTTLFGNSTILELTMVAILREVKVALVL